ncbi:unnamed protein product [Cylicocyclus nassatus]|uniref:Uncharacterized protein n=1 Tax=Cylicocyclus nassatus TaxID=53992 RepID=A0AA36GZC7_CYLNA|nr:unnamed protein product [Cylicocyclus nassatus]
MNCDVYNSTFAGSMQDDCTKFENFTVSRIISTAANIRIPGDPTKSPGSESKHSDSSRSKREEERDKAKVRRAYALGGCLMIMWLSTHAILLYRRRNEHRHLNKTVPPMSWEAFVQDYLLPGKVKTIVYQPQYEVGNVYLHSATEQLMKRELLNWIHAAPDKFSRPPDVRFYFNGDAAAVEHAIKSLQKLTHDTPKPLKEVEFDIDQFPSSRELAFIITSTLFTLAAFILVK